MVLTVSHPPRKRVGCSVWDLRKVLWGRGGVSSLRGHTEGLSAQSTLSVLPWGGGRLCAGGRGMGDSEVRPCADDLSPYNLYLFCSEIILTLRHLTLPSLPKPT